MRVFLFLCLLPFFCNANELEKIVQRSGLPSSHLGLCIISQNQIYFEKNKDQLMTPASLSKLLTAITAFKIFSPEEKFKTQLFAKKSIENGVLDSPLYLKGGGDPSFVSENLWVLVNNFTRNHIRQIKGPIYIDSSLFDENYFDESRQSLRVDRAYDSPVSASSLNWNSVNVYVRPGMLGAPADIIVDPQSDYFIVQNKVQTTSGSGADIQIYLDRQNKRERLTVQGKIGVLSKEVVKYAAIQNPTAWIGTNLVYFLKQRQIEVLDPKVESLSVPSSAYLMAEAEGWSVFELIDGMNKYSNNFIAEMLTKQIASRKGHKSASIQSGILEIQNTLKQYGMEPKNYTFINPSGFTQKNKVTACDLARMLDKAKSDFAVGPSLIATMARPGGEGTLKKRMPKGDSSIRAKTGLLNGTTGLAGYISNSKNEIFSFAFLYNGSEQGEVDSRLLFDKLALEVTK